MGGGTRGFYIRLLFRNLQKTCRGGGTRGFYIRFLFRGFYIRFLFRNLQEGCWGGGLEGFILGSYLETFTRTGGGGLEGFILGSYLETFRRAVWGGGTRWFGRNLHPPFLSLERGGTRGFYIRLLFRNLQEGCRGGGLEGFILGSYLETFRRAVGGGGTRWFGRNLHPPLSFKLNHWKGGDSKVLY